MKTVFLVFIFQVLNKARDYDWPAFFQKKEPCTLCETALVGSQALQGWSVASRYSNTSLRSSRSSLHVKN